MAQGGDHTRADISEVCSELHSARCYPSTQSIPIWNIPNIDKSAFVIPVGTDIALNVENTISVGRGAGKPSVWPGTVFPCQGFNSPARSVYVPMMLGLDSVSHIVSDNVHTSYADYTASGVNANCISLSGIRSSGDGRASSLRMPEDNEHLGPASKNEGMFHSSAYPPREIANGSPETQPGCLGEAQKYQLSLESIERWATVPISSRITASSQRPISGRADGYSCGVCGAKFAQSQGVKRHHREKHGPRQCPHCQAFRWGRLYLFKKHLKMKHPEIDLDLATSSVTSRRNRHKGAIDPGRTISPVPLSEFTPGRRCFGDTKCPTMLSPLAQPKSSPASPLHESHAETLDKNGEDASIGALRPSRRVEKSHGRGLPRSHGAGDSKDAMEDERFRAPRGHEIQH